MPSMKESPSRKAETERMPEPGRFMNHEEVSHGAFSVMSEIDPWSNFETGMMMFTEEIFADGRIPVLETARESL